MIRHVMSFDVEEYFHVETFRGTLQAAGWEAMESRADRSTREILDLLDETGVEATFFVLGWLARRLPHLVKEIDARGHEVASHGYGHELVYGLSPEGFLADIRQSRDLLSDLSGQPVVGYRAPTFSVTRRNPWALDCLVEAGYQYDSSIFPIRHDRYGIPNFPAEPVRIEWEGGDTLDEYPMALLETPVGRIPVAGGGYFRLFPAPLLRAAWTRLTTRQVPSIFYLHPWELDPGQPRIRVGIAGRIRHYTGLTRTRGRLSDFLRRFPWTSFRARRAVERPQRLMRRDWFGAAGG